MTEKIRTVTTDFRPAFLIIITEAFLLSYTLVFDLIL